MEQTLLPLGDDLATIEEIDGRDEMNLAEFPLFSLKRRIPSDLKTLSYETEVEDRRTGRKFLRKFQMTAGDAYGLPTARDGDVLMALLYFCKEQNKLEEPTVHFSRYEMARLLGWDDSGKTYRDIQTALLRWVGVTLEYQRSWWDKGDKRWKTIAFHVLEDAEISDGIGRTPQGELPLASVRFSRQFFRSLENGNVKKFNLAPFFSFNVPAAKQMYRFLDKRFYNVRRLEFDLREFACERIGFARGYKPSKLKLKLKPALAELESAGFIKPATAEERYLPGTGRGQWTIVFEREERKTLPKPLSGSKNERTVNRQLVKELTDRGVTPMVAHGLVEDKSIGEDRIRQKMELLDWYLEECPKEAPGKPAGWLVKAIRDDYTPPKGFRTKEQRTEAKAAIKARLQQKAAKERVAEENRQREANEKERLLSERWSRVEEYLDTLPLDEREQSIEKAIADHPNGFHRKSAVKFCNDPTPGTSWEISYQTILIDTFLDVAEKAAA